MNPGKLHETLKPLEWLLGTWKSVIARASYPTMKCPLYYEECLSFTSIGQPLLNYNSVTWNAADKSPKHLEAGFLRFDETGCTLLMLTVQTFGISTVEEGIVQKNMLMTDTKSISFLPTAYGRVVALKRCYSLNEKGQLTYKLELQTPKTPLTLHLECLYDKQGDSKAT